MFHLRLLSAVRCSTLFRTLKMNSIERVASNNKIAEDLIQSLKDEIQVVRNKKIQEKIVELELQNAILREQVDTARQMLIDLEVAHNKPQVSIGVTPVNVPVAAAAVPARTTVTANPPADSAQPKEKKAKKEKAPSTAAAAVAPAVEAPIDIGRLDLRVGRIVEVSRHPDAESLYLEKIDCGEPQPRTVISGLVKHVPIDEMTDRMVIVLCNLKPAKMRGILSEAMVMCASSPDKVEILSPPAGAQPGDLVDCDGYERRPDAQMNPKKKIFETVAPDLLTNGNMIACFKGAPLSVKDKGVITSQTLKNVPVK